MISAERRKDSINSDSNHLRMKPNYRGLRSTFLRALTVAGLLSLSACSAPSPTISSTEKNFYTFPSTDWIGTRLGLFDRQTGLARIGFSYDETYRGGRGSIRMSTCFQGDGQSRLISRQYVPNDRAGYLYNVPRFFRDGDCTTLYPVIDLGPGEAYRISISTTPFNKPCSETYNVQSFEVANLGSDIQSRYAGFGTLDPAEITPRDGPALQPSSYFQPGCLV